MTFSPYAETHFKFRLPWSPLHKRWPEIFLDAPHQLLPGKPLTVYLLVKDADLFPTVIRSVGFTVQDDQGCSHKHEFPLDVKCDQNLFHQRFSLPRNGLRGGVRVQGWITAENSRGQSQRFLNHNYPGLESLPLEVDLMEHALPHSESSEGSNPWLAGEMHCHSEFSSDPVEFGAPLELMQETADAVGLDFVLCTDHSYDFYYRRDRYLESVDPHKNFTEYRQQVDNLNASRPSLPTLIAGEEVSCANAKGENVHLLVFGPQAFLPGLGDGGRRGLNNKPDCTLAEILEKIPGIPCFAAHPKAKIGWLEKKIFRRGAWNDSDLRMNASAHRSISGVSGVRGLQFWNGNLGADYRDGKTFWIQQLLSGKRLLPIAANDAHGDFNRNIGVKFPLFSLRQGRSHVFGKVRTLVRSPRKTGESLRQSFLGEQCLCTDGPFLDINPTPTGMQIQARSNPDFGALESIKLYSGSQGDASEKLVREWNWKTGTLNFDELCPTAIPRSGYMRSEATTHRGRRALTSAHFPD